MPYGSALKGCFNQYSQRNLICFKIFQASQAEEFNPLWFISGYLFTPQEKIGEVQLHRKTALCKEIFFSLGTHHGWANRPCKGDGVSEKPMVAKCGLHFSLGQNFQYNIDMI